MCRILCKLTHFLPVFDALNEIFSNFAPSMKEMQFLAIVLMTLLTMKLLILPRRAVSNHAMSHSRWLMVISTALLATHFLLQYRLELRLVDS